ncbi:hypothetical protein BH23VER1_BH23VER1_10260 [soil metagenome]
MVPLISKSLLATATLAFLCAFFLRPAEGAEGAAPIRWDEGVVGQFQRLPIQDGGRVKPMDTFAQFKLLKMAGKRTVEVERGGEEVKLSSVEWLLDVLFYPEMAKGYPIFIVDNADAIFALGLTPHRGEKRGRYSYLEIEPARQALYEQGKANSEIKESERTITQRMIVDLAGNVNEFEFLANGLNFAREPVAFDADGVPDALVGTAEGGRAVLATTEVLGRLEALQEYASAGEVSESFREAFQKFQFNATTATALSIFPPMDAAEEKWLSPGELIMGAFGDEGMREWAMPRLALIEDLVAAVGDEGAFEGRLAALASTVVDDAKARGEYKKIPLEVSFYKTDYFTVALALYVLVFLIAAMSWFSPGSQFGRVVGKVAMIGLLVPTAFLVTGIVMRCIIRSRPPVSTLYETILFITAVIVIVAFCIELITRKKIALPLAAFLGAAGMFLSIKYEMKEAVDTMPSLVAVLDTNFWLSTHVTTVTMGYAAGLLATAKSFVYMIGRSFDLHRKNQVFFQALSRMVYGVICFGLLFSLVGTVLGGIWANYSWGRFWGWDPKENGALMIVIWNLVILHARMGGYIRELGLHQCALFGGIIVAFSWWHVNLLEVGLHSYGFTSGLKGSLFLFYGIVLVAMLWGFVLWLLARRRTPTRTQRHKNPATAPAQGGLAGDLPRDLPRG